MNCSVLAFLSMVIFLFSTSHSQSSRHRPPPLSDDLEVPGFHPLAFLTVYFPSELIGTGIELKSYVRSKRFRALRGRFGDLRAVDALYIRALRLTHGNIGMALLYCTVATMDHHVVGIKNPLFSIFIPLTGESLEEFTERLNNLPSHFYTDAPNQDAGARDKLQHFFGSAFIANVFESRAIAERLGAFVEWGEDAFIFDGAYDERDLRANRQGREFGLALLAATDLRSVLPSHFLALPVAENQSLSTPITKTGPDIFKRTVPRVVSPTRCGAW